MGSLLNLEIMTYIRHNIMLQNKEYVKAKKMVSSLGAMKTVHANYVVLELSRLIWVQFSLL
jgi:hypothetical protein